MTNSIKFPAWFNLITVLFFISNMFIFGLATLFNPGFAFPGAGEAADFPIQFFAVRHIALSVPLFHGLIKRDVKVLRTMYSIFIVMSVLDIVLLGIYDYPIPVLGTIPFIGNFPVFGSVIFGITVFLLPIIFSLRYLRNLSEQ